MKTETYPDRTASRKHREQAEATIGTRVAIQIQVIIALMIRNVIGRYGRGNLGFLWLIAEPIFLVGGVIVLWTYLHPTGAHGVSVAAFVISGYMPLTLWRHLSSSVRLMSTSYGLLYYRRVTVFDIIIARSLTEIAGVGAAGIVVFLMLLSVGLVDWVQDAALVLIGWLMMCWIGFGAGCLIAGLSEKSDIIENLIQPVQYLILPISGVFYMVSWLPKSVQSYALVMPLVHVYEMFRAGFFGEAVETHYSIGYAALCATLLTAAGIWAMRTSRKRLAFR